MKDATTSNTIYWSGLKNEKGTMAIPFDIYHLSGLMRIAS